MTDNLISKELLAEVVHDLKTPISAVLSNLDLLENMGPLTAGQQQCLDRAIRGLNRMDTLVASILDIVRLDSTASLNFEDCQLNDVISGTVEMVSNLAEAQQITIATNVDAKLALVRGDADLLGRALNNLLTNAIKYNSVGGSIEVTASNQPDFLRVDVRDSGVGIPESDLPHIFDRFFRASNSAQSGNGSGLGLAIVKAIVQKHGGYIWASSKLGEGTVISFTLPLKPISQHRDLPEQLPSAGERHDLAYDDYSIEEVDDVDDNTQEARGSSEIDSSNDVV